MLSGISQVEAAERVDALREASRKSKEAGEGRKPRGPPMTEEEKKKKRNEALAAKRAKEREEKAEAERQRREAVAALMVSNGAAEGAAAALAAGAQSLPDELLPGSTLQPPQGERLSPPPGATDRELPLLLQLHAFLGRFQSVLGLDAVPPSAAALHDLLASDPSSSPAAWADCASLHGCLVRCLVREAYDELLAYVKDTSDLVQKDLANAGEGDSDDDETTVMMGRL